jgi:hypothetical protein
VIKGLLGRRHIGKTLEHLPIVTPRTNSYPRKPKYGNRMGGIKPAHFFEPAMNGTDELWKNKFVETLKKKAKERKLLDE